MLGKKSGKNIRDISQREHKKCGDDCFVSKGADFINNVLYHILEC